MGWPYKILNQIREKLNTPNIVIIKKKNKPNPWKLQISKLNSSHSIKNFIKIGKPLKINKAAHIRPDKKGANTDKPPSAGNILVP